MRGKGAEKLNRPLEVNSVQTSLSQIRKTERRHIERLAGYWRLVSSDIANARDRSQTRRGLFGDV